MQVIYWYHRQFVEAAETRYCQGEISLKLHAALADYFGGTWANGKAHLIHRETDMIRHKNI